MLGVIPEAVEYDALACLESRTAAISSFRDLGPLDLVQLTKMRQGTETSTYHSTSGVNISSSAAAAAHLNTLTFSLGDGQVWFGSTRHWKVVNGTYCAWNAFSHVDVRIKATIPGGVEEYTVSQGSSPGGTITKNVSERCWLETYMSAMVRCLIYADDDSFFVECSRRDDPFTSVADFKQFLSAFEALFGFGPQLGSSPKYQLSTLTANYMVDAFFLACQVTQRWDDARECIKRIAKVVPEAGDLLVRLNLLSNREIDAVREMVNIVEQNPRNAEMLVQESNFVLEKGDPDLAYECALRAANASPGQFFSWEMLAKVYIAQEKYADALLALNSRPMVPRAPMDTVKMPAPRKIHSPLPTDGEIQEIWNINTSEVDTVDPNLLKLTGGTLRGGSKWAYDLVARIFAKVGWSELMHIRGDIFLMETEASRDTDKSEDKHNGKEVREKEQESQESQEPQKEGDSPIQDHDSTAEAQHASAVSSELAKATASVESAGGAISTQQAPELAASSATKSIKSKRLCERRLDMLFMTLWEDARAHSHWQREAVHFESAQTSYTKTATEWEILGCVAQRLHYNDQAMAAFTKSMQLRFCHRVALHMLDYFAPVDGKIRNTSQSLQLLVKLYAWNHRWHVEFSPRLRITLNKIVQSEGILKVLTEVQASFNGDGVVRLIEHELEKIKMFEG